MKVVILSTRISGNDGVSIECRHWKSILTSMGHKVKLIAGQLDQKGILLPSLFFQSPEIVDVYNQVIYGNEKYKKVEKDIFTISGKIEGEIREVLDSSGKRCDLLIVPNVFSLPMNIPLAVALARIISEYKIPTIARHHDFWWQRKRFLKSSMFPFFKKWFPPGLPLLSHVVVNSMAKAELEKRTGVKAEVIWDSFDFSSKLNKIDSFTKHFRGDFGIAKDDIIFLQATRIVPRKRVELAIEFIEKLDNPKAVLVVAGRGGDEGAEYEERIRNLAKKSKSRILFIGERVNTHRKIVGGERHYTFWGCYVNSDFVIYPTEIEGFGNQFVETMYFKKPTILTPYPVYKKDIKPLGFKVVEMPDKVTDEVITEVNDLIENAEKVQSMVEKNFAIGKKYFSYKSKERIILKLLKKMGLPRNKNI